MQLKAKRRLESTSLRDAVAPFARVGYAARGLIYAVIGIFAVLSAFGNGEKKDSHGALQTIMQHTAGNILAWALMIGLLSYALWRLAQSILDTDNHGSDAKGLAIRAGLLASAGTYSALLVYTFALWNGTQSSSGGRSQLAASLAGFVGTRVIAWALVAVFVGVGAAHIFKAVKKRYARYFDASPRVMEIVHPVARTGLVARGLVFFVIAVLFFYRGVSVGGGGGNPGLAAALGFIQGLPAGHVLLAATGLGLLAFSAYSFSEAVWRRIRL